MNRMKLRWRKWNPDGGSETYLEEAETRWRKWVLDGGGVTCMEEVGPR